MCTEIHAMWKSSDQPKSLKRHWLTDNSWISVTYSYIWEVFTMEKLRKILKETIPLVQVWRWFLGYVDDWLWLLCDFFSLGEKTGAEHPY